jgi:hypothetical protein
MFPVSVRENLLNKSRERLDSGPALFYPSQLVCAGEGIGRDPGDDVLTVCCSWCCGFSQVDIVSESESFLASTGTTPDFWAKLQRRVADD